MGGRLNPVDRRVLMIGIGLFVVAAALRLALASTARFGGDEALFFRIGMDIVEGRAFPLLGTQITDGAAKLPGPAFLYLMALPLLVWRAPEAQFIFTELLGAATVVGAWLSLRQPLGERSAALVGVFFACAPWAALFADRTWNPNVLPAFVVVAVGAALRLRESPSSHAAVVLWPALFVLPQLHMSAPVVWCGVLALVGVEALRRGNRRRHGLGLFLGALLYLPLLVHEVQTGLGNTTTMAREILGVGGGGGGGDRHPFGFAWVPVYALRLLSLDVSYHELSGYWGGPDEWRCLRVLVEGSPARPFHPLRAGALVASVVVSLSAWAGAIVAARRDRRHAQAAVRAAVVAVIANTALMGVAGKQVFGHYVIGLMPFLLVLLGVALREVSSWSSVWPARALAVGLAVTCIGGVEATLSVSRSVDARIGLEVHRRAAAVIAADAEARGLPQQTPIALFFVGLRSSHYDWHIFATRALGLPWHFDPRARERRYALTPADASPPRGAVGAAVDVGHAWLWRLP